MGDVIYRDFKPKQASRPTRVSDVSGVFIKPCGCDETFFQLRGNVGGVIASYIAFHPDFSPSLFGDQIRSEMGIMVVNDDTPPDAA